MKVFLALLILFTASSYADAIATKEMEAIYAGDGFQNPLLAKAVSLMLEKVKSKEDARSIIVTGVGKNVFEDLFSLNLNRYLTIHGYAQKCPMPPIAKKGPSVSEVLADPKSLSYAKLQEAHANDVAVSEERRAQFQQCADSISTSAGYCYVRMAPTEFLGWRKDREYILEIQPESCPFLNSIGGKAIAAKITRVSPTELNVELK